MAEAGVSSLEVMEGEAEGPEEEEASEAEGPDYRLEAVRLGSFAAWSRVSVVAVDKLARAGFFAVGPGDRVRCFHCGLELERWRFGDSAAGRHATAAPQCTFISGASDAGNVPAANSVRTRGGADPPTESHPSQGMESESLDPESAARLRSFRHWPKEATVAAARLAAAGFAYAGRGDTVECESCGGRLQQWLRGDDPLQEHLAHFPLCGLARRLGRPQTSPSVSPSRTAPNVVVRGVSSSSAAPCSSGDALKSKEEATPESVLAASLRSLGVFTAAPAAEWAATLGSRLSTFAGWPATAHQRPLQLATAGFYYRGLEDRVMCFHCGGGLWNWAAGDSAYREHARWFPDCDYIRLCKGPAYVEEAAGDGSSEESSSRGRKRVPTIQSTDRVDFAALEENGVSTRSADVRGALDMGFKEAAICAAIVANGWRSFDGPEDLITALTDTDAAGATAAPASKTASSASSESAATSPTHDLQSELAFLREQRRCKICMDAEECVVLLPCGHLCCCTTCAPALKACPLCRSAIKGRIKALFA